MSFGYRLANSAVNAIMGFRDKGWEKAFQDASDMIVNLGSQPANEAEQGLEVMNMDLVEGFMDVFGCMTPPMTPMAAAPARGAGFAFTRGYPA